MRRNFLGWSGALGRRVASWLVDNKLRDPTSLAGCWVVVPTANAGRVLKSELLATMTLRGASGLLMPGILTPQQALASLAESLSISHGRRLATRLECEFAWAATLATVSEGECLAILPRSESSPPPDSEAACMIARKLMAARSSLAEAGYDATLLSSSDLLPTSDASRWSDFAHLETRYRKRLATAELADPDDMMREAAMTGRLPPGIHSLVLAATPDPMRLLLTLARTYEKNGGEVHVLVDAPDCEEDAFDEWGLPVASAWSQRGLSMEEFEDLVHVLHGAEEQAEALANLAESCGENRTELILGAASSDLVPHMEHALAIRGIPTYDPGAGRLSQCRAFTALDLAVKAGTSGEFRDVCAFLRLPVVHDWLARLKHLASTSELLNLLDMASAEGLPVTLDEAIAFCTRHPQRFASLGGLLEFVRKAISLPAAGTNAFAWLRQLAQDLFRDLDPDPVERQFLEQLGSELAGLEASPLAPALPPALVIRRLLDSCAAMTARKVQPDAAVGILGWLELSWAPASRLVVAGCSDGCLPQVVDADSFLPEPLRRRLGLPSNESRLARDAYLMRTLIEHVKEQQGRVDFLCGLHDGEGSPATPSRLFMLGSGTTLPGRVTRLFSDPGPVRKTAPQTLAWQLDPTASNNAQPIIPHLMRVTGFGAYLRCPFRFYLGHVLRIEEQQTDRLDMDARQFGTFCHAALEEWAKNASLCQSTDGEEIANFLAEIVERMGRDMFGDNPPATVRIQLDLAKARVRAAGHVLARETAHGWQVVTSEWGFGGDDGFQIAGLPVAGRIDLIQRHRSDGRWRVLDYKTTDKKKKPEDVHLGPAPGPKRAHLGKYAHCQTPGGRLKTWSGLQLPLYLMAMGELFKEASGATMEAGYLTLTQAAEDTDVLVWREVHAFMDQARSCAEGIVRDVLAGRFWPPADIPACFDEFAGILFPGGDCGVRHAALLGKSPDA